METITKEHQGKINALKEVLEELYNATNTEGKVFCDLETDFHTAYEITTNNYKFRVLAQGSEFIRLFFIKDNKVFEQSFLFFSEEHVKSNEVKELILFCIKTIEFILNRPTK